MTKRERRMLVVGTGAREHALVQTLFRGDNKVFAAPGNPGMSGLATCVDIPVHDIAGLVTFARQQKIDLTLVGGEEPLVAGIRDAFNQAKLPLFGPTKSAARLEGSKVWAKEFMSQYGIPTAAYQTANHKNVVDAVRQHPLPFVLKQSGLARGKGVVVVDSLDTLVQAQHWLTSHKSKESFVLEDFLVGPELSVFYLVDGASYCLLGVARDYKRAFDGDTGPLTGGMGAFSPVPGVSPELLAAIEFRILRPTLRGLLERGSPYQGWLYLGLMLTADGPKVLEYNCRLGDPEAQVILARLQDDLTEVLLAVQAGDMPTSLKMKGHALGVVLASEGYPDQPIINRPVTIPEKLARPDTLVFTGGVGRDGDRLVTNGGRVYTVVGKGTNLASARMRAYTAIAKLKIPGAYYRRDVGLNV